MTGGSGKSQAASRRPSAAVRRALTTFVYQHPLMPHIKKRAIACARRRKWEVEKKSGGQGEGEGAKRRDTHERACEGSRDGRMAA